MHHKKTVCTGRGTTPMQSGKLQLFLLARSPFTLFKHFSHATSLWLVGYSIRSAKCLESFMESPFDGFLYRLIKHEWQERHSSQTQLFEFSVSQGQISTTKKDTYSNRSIGSYVFILCVLQGPSRIPYDTVNRKSWQSHRRYALKNGPLNHDAPEVLDGRNMSDLWSPILCCQRLPRICHSHRQNSWYAWMFYALIPQVSLVAFVPYVSNQICP